MNTPLVSRPSARPHRPSRALLAGAFLAALLAVDGAVLHTALAASYRSYGQGGRIYDPARLRPKADSAPRGRAMSRPPIPDPEERQLVRPKADIPNPEAHSRGGAGLVRRGKYFYEEPQPPTLARKTGTMRRPTVPNPEIHIPKRSAATR